METICQLTHQAEKCISPVQQSLIASNKIEKTALRHMGLVNKDNRWVFKDELLVDDVEPINVDKSQVASAVRSKNDFEKIVLKQLGQLATWQKENHQYYLQKFDSLDEKICAIQRRLLKHHIGGGSDSSELPCQDDGNRNMDEDTEDDGDEASSSF